MGANQSSPAANGRTRAYSGSDVPSSTSNGRTAAMDMRYHAYAASSHGASGATSAGTQHHSHRTRYSGGGSGTRPQSLHQSGFGNIANSSYGSGSSTPEENSGERDPTDRDQEGPRLLIGSLPAHLSPHLFGGFKCPVCSKFVASDEMDLHLVMCLTKPRVTYNEDVLAKDSGECAICLEELVQGDTIARLPCLCIYHKGFPIPL
ncbi:hypothetical protein SKAU_G00402320 [Synaphobranchus kaupii]|uniref:RING-type E3 ubiquitin transferase n=1 Tax=Synaphobranchus kaupii TaxID=118154 RepID=A0A9Q1E9A2_SYNKA|nr:hypothetical protein SKAU_G00402320 [Synaphobranchus kaupii]